MSFADIEENIMPQWQDGFFKSWQNYGPKVLEKIKNDPEIVGGIDMDSAHLAIEWPSDDEAMFPVMDLECFYEEWPLADRSAKLFETGTRFWQWLRQQRLL